jgi:hypothetical protein
LTFGKYYDIIILKWERRSIDMEAISIYTRQQAIEDGQLFDVTNTQEAREAGFVIPICLTCGVTAYVDVPEDLAGSQDLKGRLWDTLYMAVAAYKRAEDKYLVPFEVSYQMSAHRREVVTLWLVFNEHEGFTVMLPSEY